MQTLFAGHMDKESGKLDLSRDLNNHIDDLIKLYLVFFKYLTEIPAFSQIHSAQKTDLLKIKSNLTEILQNKLIIQLQENSKLTDAMIRYKIEELIDPEIIRPLFIQWSATESFKSYCKNDEHTLEEDKEVVLELLNHILLTNTVLHAHLEGLLLDIWDDMHLVAHHIDSEIKMFDGNNDPFTQVIYSWEEEKEFATTLLEKTYDNKTELMELIDQKLKNWDLDRVAQMDIILMQMALSELMYFETIPVKVSINEYIDLSKRFSTPKSKEFINGILDNIMKELKEQGKIKKVGRGLVEN